MMKPLGIVRNIDALGRIVIPMEIRRQNNWEENQPVEMFADDKGGLYIKAYRKDEERKEILSQLENLSEKFPIGETSEILSTAIEFIKSKA